MKINTFDPIKNKHVCAGEFDPTTLTFTKKVSPRHYMIIEHGYGISENVLRTLQELGCCKIKIITKMKEYNSILSDWMCRPIMDYGHGKQRFLSVEIMK